jgi:thiamine biosynthesis protein ThiI
MDCIICRYGELALKGKNRGIFERKLVDNIKDCVRRSSIDGVVKKSSGRVFVFTKDRTAVNSLKRVFGLVSLSPAVAVDCDKEKIKQAVVAYLEELSPKKGTSFRITSKRANKTLPFDSRELNTYVGGFIESNFDLKVELSNPELEICIDIRETAFIFHETLPCFGGLPLGTGGKVACIMEDEKSVLAAWLMMRRGVAVFPIVLKKVDLSLLTNYDYGFSLVVKDIISIDEINSIVQEHDYKAVVVGDTIDNFGKERYSKIDSVVLYPLISYGAEEISSMLERLR